MTLPVNATKFSVKQNTLILYDTMVHFWRHDPQAWIPLPIIKEQAESADYYAVRGMLIKFARAGLIAANYDASPAHFRLIDPEKYGPAQIELMRKFDSVREVFGVPSLPPVPAEAHNRPNWR